MKTLAILMALAATASYVQASEIVPEKTQQQVDDVVEMKSYDKGGIRIFLADEEEPAARPYKVVVSLPVGGEEITEYASFDVGKYCRVDLKNATTTTHLETWKVRTIRIPVAHYSPDTGKCDQKDVLTLEAKLMDDNESSLKASTLK